jgi:hypothetical protein
MAIRFKNVKVENLVGTEFVDLTSCVNTLTLPSSTRSFNTAPACLNADENIVVKTPGSIDPGFLTISYSVKDIAELKEFFDQFIDGSPVTYKISVPQSDESDDLVVFTFNGFIQTFSADAATADGVLVFTHVIKLSENWND